MQQLDLFAAFESAVPENKTTKIVADASLLKAEPPVLVTEEIIETKTDDETAIEINTAPAPLKNMAEIADEEIKKLPVVNTPAEEFVTIKQHKRPKHKDLQETQKPAGKRGRKSYSEMDADIVMVEVPDDETLFAKQYYGMSQVAEWFHVNQSLLRYWENEFDILKPRKTRKGDRLFRPEDIKNLQLIYFLLRQRKFSIEGAKQYLKDNRQKADVNMQLIQSLTKFRAFLLEWKANLDT
ncbi:MAG TPA: MerR family transcriptional regulator [Panacibacter sp.]|nr:MerR family transcriptional regulator [Panacibacter sp.]